MGKVYAVSRRSFERQSGIGRDSVPFTDTQYPRLFIANGMKYEAIDCLLVSPNGNFARAVEVQVIRPEDEAHLDDEQRDLMGRVHWINYGEIPELKIDEGEDSICYTIPVHEDDIRRMLERVLSVDETWNTAYEI